MSTQSRYKPGLNLFSPTIMKQEQWPCTDPSDFFYSLNLFSIIYGLNVRVQATEVKCCCVWCFQVGSLLYSKQTQKTGMLHSNWFKKMQKWSQNILDISLRSSYNTHMEQSSYYITKSEKQTFEHTSLKGELWGGGIKQNFEFYFESNIRRTGLLAMPQPTMKGWLICF